MEEVVLALPRLSSAFFGFRIAQISDIHLGGWMNRERLQHVVQKVLAQSPDLLVITGDFVSGHVLAVSIYSCPGIHMAGKL